jgi:hypothetical protein
MKHEGKAAFTAADDAFIWNEDEGEKEEGEEA